MSNAAAALRMRVGEQIVTIASRERSPHFILPTAAAPSNMIARLIYLDPVEHKIMTTGAAHGVQKG